jgi:hypothetical protein
MMDELDLDRAIDAATRAMVAREPSRALDYRVMARVKNEATPVPQRFVSATAVVAAVVCAAIAVVLVYRMPFDFPPLPAPRTVAIAQPLKAVAAPATVWHDAAATRRVARASIGTRAAVPTQLPSNDVSGIEPLETQPITFAAVEVPQLESEATTIDSLDLEPLTIEPLAASND